MLVEQEVKNNDKLNIVFLSGEVYRKPEEKLVQKDGIESLLRRVQIKFDNSCWVFLVFTDIELWSKAKNLKLGQFIKVRGSLSTIFSPEKHRSYTKVNVTEIIEVLPTKNIFISQKTIKERKKTKKKGFNSGEKKKSE